MTEQVTMSSSKMFPAPSSPSTKKLAELIVITGMLISDVTVSAACSASSPATALIV